MYILPQIAQRTQRNAASCIISQRKTICLSIVVLGFVCVNQRDQRENRPFTYTKTMSMNIKNNNNGRSHGKKMQKLKKIRVNEYRVKFYLNYVECRRNSLNKKNGLYCSRNFRKLT